MTMMTVSDVSEVIEALREYGYTEQDIMSVVEGIETDDIQLSWVADFIYAMEIGDDDEAFVCACALGIA